MKPMQLLGAISLSLSVIGCGGSDDLGLNPTSFVETELSVCNPANATFTLNIDNNYFPLPVGRMWTLEGQDEGRLIRLESEVLNQTETVGGVTTRIVTETEFIDGALYERTSNYFAQNGNGDVCYFGEDVEFFENGVAVSSSGSWRAEGGNLPGLLMPAVPVLNTQFSQEVAPGVAEDKSAIYQLGLTHMVPFANYNDVVGVLDWNPLEGDTINDGELKYFAPGVGLIQDENLALIDYVAGGQVFAELDIAVCDPANTTFSLNINNSYFPLPVGRRLVLEGDDDGEMVRLEIDVLDQIEVVGGIDTRVVTETEYKDGELFERTFNYFAQNAAGDVCYFGEDVEFFENGVVVSTDGTWRAEGGNKPGIQMPAVPVAMTQYFQEVAPGVAEDKSAINELGLTRTTAAGTFVDVIGALDWNVVEGQTIADAEAKYFAPGVGLIGDEVLELVQFQ